VPRQELVGESLAALQPGRSLRRTVDRMPGRAEPINDGIVDQWALGADDGQADALLPNKGEHLVHVADGQGHVLADQSSAALPGAV